MDSPRSTAGAPGATARSPRSCPAQNPRPAPVSTKTRAPARGRLGQRMPHLVVHRHIEAVELVGPVQSQPCDAALDDEQDGFIGHRRAPGLPGSFLVIGQLQRRAWSAAPGSTARSPASISQGSSAMLCAITACRPRSSSGRWRKFPNGTRTAIRGPHARPPRARKHPSAHIGKLRRLPSMTIEMVARTSCSGPRARRPVRAAASPNRRARRDAAGWREALEPDRRLGVQDLHGLAHFIGHLPGTAHEIFVRRGDLHEFARELRESWPHRSAH